ncbi:MAG: recombinase [Burkholderiales bacterium]|nr:recombinase [Burkholderiales bacterium]
MAGPARAAGADLDTLLAQADPAAPTAERHLWLMQVLDWLRHGDNQRGADLPLAVLRLRHLLGVLENNTTQRAAVAGVLRRLVAETEVAALFADLGFSARRELWGALVDYLHQRLLPGTPDSADLAQLFTMFFNHVDDAHWLRAIDEPTLRSFSELLWASEPGARLSWRQPFFEAITYLASAVRAIGFTPALRRRIGAEQLAQRPFERLVGGCERFVAALEADDLDSARATGAQLHALLAQCRAAAASVHGHLDAFGISVDLVFELEQLRLRTLRIEALLDVLLSPQPQLALQVLVAELVDEARSRASVRALMSQHYALLARKVVERSADTGEHYITRSRTEYRQMLVSAAGGGVVIAGTVFLKFALVALGLSAFWGGFWAGINYALSFVLVHLAGWTVATKQPAMTAPTLARRLEAFDLAANGHTSTTAASPPAQVPHVHAPPVVTSLLAAQPAEPAVSTSTSAANAASLAAMSTPADHGNIDAAPATAAAQAAPEPAPTPPLTPVQAAAEGLVDEVAHLIRSQIAGIVGNLLLVVPVVLAAQALAWWLRGSPLIDVAEARHILHDLTLLGPTAAYAAFTGVLLFAASLIAGWFENWFVWHRLDSAIAWNPGFVSVLGAERAKRWSVWWRHNVSGMAANVSLGLLLGIVPALATFFALPIEVRHVTLATGQIAAALGTLGPDLLHEPALWWCVAAIPFIGALNLLVSFTLALRLALRARGVKLQDRGLLYAALRQRLRHAPGSFIMPPRQADDVMVEHIGETAH